MKKLLLSTAIAAAIGAAGAVQAQPVVDQVDIDQGYIINAIADTVEFEAGFGASAGTTRFVRFDISTGAFARALTGADLTGSAVIAAGSSAPDDNTRTVVSGGAAGDTFVVFEVETVAGEYTQTDIFDVSAIAAQVVLGTKATSVSISYKQTESASGATLAGASGSEAVEIDYLSILDNAITANTDVLNIDVTQNGIFFDAGTEEVAVTSLGTVEIGATSDDVFGEFSDTGTAAELFGDDRKDSFDVTTGTAGANALAFGDVFAESTVTLTGDFSSADAIRFFENSTCAATSPVTVTVTQAMVDAGEIVVDLNAGSLVGTHTGDICFVANGEDVIAESDYSVTWNGTGEAGYVDVSATEALASLERNGSRAELNMLLAPDGAFKNFVRITNPSTIDGRVFLELINDEGVSEPFNLNDVAVNGVAQPASIAAGASTRLIPVSAIAEAAGLASVSDNNRNKLRLIVDGEFGETGETTGVRLENVTLATDNTTFSTF